jgi:hypothetical protein
MSGGRMRRQTKYLLVAIGVAMLVWIGGVLAIGLAEVRHLTASGVVEMRNAHQVSRALSDPTFATTYSWGSITLHGSYWGVLIPFGGAALSFATVVLISIIRRRKVTHLAAAAAK